MTANYYTAHTRTTRAASAHHTEAGAKRDNGILIIREDTSPRLFAVGDTVKVIDDDSIHVGFIGHISQFLSYKRYLVKFDWNDTAVIPFHERQIRKIEPRKKSATRRKRKLYFQLGKVDAFSCEWGSCEIEKHPDIPERWAARHIPSEGVLITPPPPAVLLLPERCATTIAHEKFMAFMEMIEKPRYTLPELYAYIETRILRKQQEAAFICEETAFLERSA